MAHPNLAVVSPERETMLAVTRFNIYEDKLDTELFDPNSGQKSPLELFKPFNMKVSIIFIYILKGELTTYLFSGLCFQGVPHAFRLLVDSGLPPEPTRREEGIH